MQISQLAREAGVSPRALRHYEAQGLLSPTRTSAGYRVYSDRDIVTVKRIKIMLSAGLTTALIGDYLDCVRTPDEDPVVDMCPALRAELDVVAARLDEENRRIARTQQHLDALRGRGSQPRPGEVCRPS